MTYLVTDIQWDTDDEEFDLPNSLTIKIPTDITVDIDVEDYISDKISDITGFCHFGFSCEQIK